MLLKQHSAHLKQNTQYYHMIISLSHYDVVMAQWYYRMIIKVQTQGSTVGQTTAYSALSDLPRALRRNGLVILSYDNKSADPRVHGWADNCLFSSIRFTTCAPPLTPIGYACKSRKCAGKYYIHNLLKSWFTQGFEPMMGTEPCSALLLSYYNTTKPLRHHNGLVVLSYYNIQGTYSQETALNLRVIRCRQYSRLNRPRE